MGYQVHISASINGGETAQTALKAASKVAAELEAKGIVVENINICNNAGQPASLVGEVEEVDEVDDVDDVDDTKPTKAQQAAANKIAKAEKLEKAKAAKKAAKAAEANAEAVAKGKNKGPGVIKENLGDDDDDLGVDLGDDVELPTEERLREAISLSIINNEKEGTKKILKKLGHTSIPGVKPEDRQELIDELEAE